MIVLLVIAFVLGLLVLLPRNIAKAVGWHLQRRTRTRRGLILARVDTEQQAYPPVKERASPKSDDEGWEKVERYTGRGNDLQRDEDWQGIIGFFHPFWCVFNVRL